MLRSTLLASALALSLPATAQTAKDYSQAKARYDLQPNDKSITAYLHSWDDYNNQQHLDDRDGCYTKAKGALILILEMDDSGKVVGFFADKDDPRAACWRSTYMGVVFPQPPFAPFYRRMEMM